MGQSILSKSLQAIKKKMRAAVDTLQLREILTGWIKGLTETL